MSEPAGLGAYDAALYNRGSYRIFIRLRCLLAHAPSAPQDFSKID